MRLIDADAMKEAMYHEAFEMDSNMQKWDSGCWIRYKMFENHIKAAPTIDAVPVVRCKDCKYYKENTLVCGRYGLEDDDYCSWAERKES